jgi:hypothetical protein
LGPAAGRAERRLSVKGATCVADQLNSAGKDGACTRVGWSAAALGWGSRRRCATPPARAWGMAHRGRRATMAWRGSPDPGTFDTLLSLAGTCEPVLGAPDSNKGGQSDLPQPKRRRREGEAPRDRKANQPPEPQPRPQTPSGAISAQTTPHPRSQTRPNHPSRLSRILRQPLGDDGVERLRSPGEV